MIQLLKSPAKYVQGKGVLKDFPGYLQGMGKKIMILISNGGLERSKATLDDCFEKTDYTVEYVCLSGECTRKKVETLAEQCRKNNFSVVVGFGGGKITDTAKGVAHVAGLPVVVVPTICATNASCSSLSVLYTDEGVFDSYLFLDSCPNIVLIDSEIIAKAPTQLLVAGMGDAMAAYFEARACNASGGNNQLGGKSTISARELAGLSWKCLKKYGRKARESAAAKCVTPELENIIEVNTYISGVGFESGGLAAAHGIQKGFTVIPELHKAYHGFKVAFCTIAQLVLENAPHDEIEDVLNFCLSVGLPVTFEELGYSNVNRDDLITAAEKACAPGSTIYNLPFDVQPKLVVDALLEADRLGKNYSKNVR